MNDNHTIKWNNTEIVLVDTPDIVHIEPQYRVDCHPDPGLTKKKNFFK